MKHTGKGRGISINAPNLGNWASINGGGTSTVNAWKQELEKVKPAVHTFRPLVRWPAIPHPRQAELDQFSAMPSAFK